MSPPPPPTLCDVSHVTCSHPPQAWDSHLVVVVVVGVSGSSVVLGGSRYDFVSFYLIFFCFHLSLLQRICSGNAAHAPTFPKRNTCFISSTHTHAHTHRHPYPPMCLIPTISHPHCTHSETQPVIQTHTPTNPSQFLQIPTGQPLPPKAARIHPQH